MPDVVGTVGRIEALPGAMNVIPGHAIFTLDVRAPTDARRRAAVTAHQRRVRGASPSAATWRSPSRRCGRRGRRHAPPHMQRQFAAAIAREGVPVRHLPSGAGHDGMALIDIAPIGMLFVRCKGGISHNPAEAITLADVAIGTRVLARFILAFTPPARG